MTCVTAHLAATGAASTGRLSADASPDSGPVFVTGTSGVVTVVGIDRLAVRGALSDRFGCSGGPRPGDRGPGPGQ